jgi:hypothetical protein
MLLIGFWTFLRAVFFGSAAVALENVALRHQLLRRELLHLNVTDHPTAPWTARQIVAAFRDDSVPRFLLRDRDAIYGEAFARRVKSMDIREVLTTPRPPWQNPFVERVISVPFSLERTSRARPAPRLCAR